MGLETGRLIKQIVHPSIRSKKRKKKEKGKLEKKREAAENTTKMEGGTDRTWATKEEKKEKENSREARDQHVCRRRRHADGNKKRQQAGERGREEAVRECVEIRDGPIDSGVQQDWIHWAFGLLGRA